MVTSIFKKNFSIGGASNVYKKIRLDAGFELTEYDIKVKPMKDFISNVTEKVSKNEFDFKPFLDSTTSEVVQFTGNVVEEMKVSLSTKAPAIAQFERALGKIANNRDVMLELVRSGVLTQDDANIIVDISNKKTCSSTIADASALAETSEMNENLFISLKATLDVFAKGLDDLQKNNNAGGALELINNSGFLNTQVVENPIFVSSKRETVGISRNDFIKKPSVNSNPLAGASMQTSTGGFVTNSKPQNSGGGIFGNKFNPSPVQAQPTSNFGFGKQQTQPIFAASTTQSSPVFGQQKSTPFGQSQPTTTSGGIFGNRNTPTFGQQTSQNNNVNNIFGKTQQVSGFGVPAAAPAKNPFAGFSF